MGSQSQISNIILNAAQYDIFYLDLFPDSYQKSKLFVVNYKPQIISSPTFISNLERHMLSRQI